jgi:hypothetical protein
VLHLRENVEAVPLNKPPNGDEDQTAQEHYVTPAVYVSPPVVRLTTDWAKVTKRKEKEEGRASPGPHPDHNEQHHQEIRH